MLVATPLLAAERNPDVGHVIASGVVHPAVVTVPSLSSNYDEYLLDSQITTLNWKGEIQSQIRNWRAKPKAAMQLFRNTSFASSDSTMTSNALGAGPLVTQGQVIPRDDLDPFILGQDQAAKEVDRATPQQPPRPRWAPRDNDIPEEKLKLLLYSSLLAKAMRMKRDNLSAVHLDMAINGRPKKLVLVQWVDAPGINNLPAEIRNKYKELRREMLLERGRPSRWRTGHTSQMDWWMGKAPSLSAEEKQELKEREGNELAMAGMAKEYLQKACNNKDDHLKALDWLWDKGYIKERIGKIKTHSSRLFNPELVGRRTITLEPVDAEAGVDKGWDVALRHGHQKHEEEVHVENILRVTAFPAQFEDAWKQAWRKSLLEFGEPRQEKSVPMETEFRTTSGTGNTIPVPTSQGYSQSSVLTQTMLAPGPHMVRSSSLIPTSRVPSGISQNPMSFLAPRSGDSVPTLRPEQMEELRAQQNALLPHCDEQIRKSQAGKLVLRAAMSRSASRDSLSMHTLPDGEPLLMHSRNQPAPMPTTPLMGCSARVQTPLTASRQLFSMPSRASSVPPRPFSATLGEPVNWDDYRLDPRV
eukprot:gnl/TRDRNA2_/TRDRNA2_173484_c10_seq8.p1 gnl/TRDRNA2_/TRDRNA2_173484_c10~~gnl/TRDRNA2_/TRDRNA2_173484_c10_seq8.p1  ORF type:complete len:585 (-),score=62.97 gnl/TRDRNA2_/TRDRNA2_173484_c10_seq8:192-1946(-)